MHDVGPRNAQDVSNAAQAEDVELLSRITQGDSVAFKELLHRFTPRMLHILRARTRGFADEDDVRDLFQDTCIKVWRDLVLRQRQLDGLSLSTFVSYKARDVAGEHIRLQRRRQALLARHGEDARAHATGPPQPDSNALSRVALGEVKNTMRTLSAIDQEVLCMLLEGRSYAELALLTGHSVGALRARVSRIRGKLQRRVRGDHPGR